MATRSDITDRAILRPAQAQAHFALDRRTPAGLLGGHVEWYWQVGWDLRDREPYVSETLPHPNVHVVLEDGGLLVHGIVTRRFTRTLAGRGLALGAKFRPGAFLPVLGRPVAELTDRVVPLRDLVGADADRLETDLRRDEDTTRRVAVLDGFWSARLPDDPAPLVALLGEIFAAELDDPSPTVDALARRHGLSVRSLQRLFHRAVGAGPKAVLRRHRLQTAGERIAADPDVDLGRLAADLGYADQAHFTHDFRDVIGRTPGDYASACRERAA